MPPNFSASSLMNITILDFHSRPNTNCSEFRLPMTQLCIAFQSNISISLDLFATINISISLDLFATINISISLDLFATIKCEVTNFFL